MPDYRTIDFHNHVKPKALDEMEKQLSTTSWGGQGTRNSTATSLTPSLYSTIQDPVKDSLRNIEESGTDFVVVSLPSAGAFPPNVAVRLTKLVNDEFRKLIQAYPDRYVGLGSLPMDDIKASVVELDRMMKDLELSGVMIRANIHGVPLDDEKFRPLYEKFNDMELTVFIHPGYPPWGQAGLEQYNLGALLGYEFDTVLCATRMIFAGILDDYPKIKFVWAHLGAGLPFLVHRITAPVVEHPERNDIKAKKKPIEYVRKMYFDTATSDVESTKYALQCTYDMVGEENVLFGTDYPWHSSESIKELRGSIIKSDSLPESAKRKILGDNTRRILNLN